MKPNFKRDWAEYVMFASGVIALFASLTLSLEYAFWYLTGILVGAFGLAGASAIWGRDRREKDKKDDDGFGEMMDVLQRALMAREMSGPAATELSVEGITKAMEGFISEGENRTQEERDKAFALFHRVGCKNWMGGEDEKCECNPLKIPFNDVKRLGAETVGRMVYEEMSRGKKGGPN